jgi:hypothetical protein
MSEAKDDGSRYSELALRAVIDLPNKRQYGDAEGNSFS